MLNKKTKIIILVIIILFLSLVLIFALRAKNKNAADNKNNNITALSENEASSTANKIPTAATSTNVGPENTDNKELREASNAKFLAELKTNHPEYSAAQLEFYGATAAKGEMVSCRDRDDENSCISAVAFITRADGFCGEINDKTDQLACSNVILDEKAALEISQCQSSGTDDLKARCLINIFNAYKQAEDCANLKTDSVKETCESVAYCQMALTWQNNKLCDVISNKYIRIYCSESIVDKLQDSDGDGLSDEEETNKYKTDPFNPDTDGDGYKDGEEVKNGFNPNGPGKLITNK
ncbi:MAG: hypothetical protein NTY31_02055 [Candidatus Falkowbacteria bacterium]|nr:hypothetical protein [Candidatus Falkowbacteria bacterium]